jgi:hypothetical protein
MKLVLNHRQATIIGNICALAIGGRGRVSIDRLRRAAGATTSFTVEDIDDGVRLMCITRIAKAVDDGRAVELTSSGQLLAIGVHIIGGAIGKFPRQMVQDVVDLSLDDVDGPSRT